MSQKEIVSKEIASVIDILEQLEDVNRMIKIHVDDRDSLMMDQYKYRKDKLLKELADILQGFEINLTDLAA